MLKRLGLRGEHPDVFLTAVLNHVQPGEQPGDAFLDAVEDAFAYLLPG